MKHLTKETIERARTSWAYRHEQPAVAAEALVDLITEGAFTPYQAALLVGARPAEIPGYIDLAALDEAVRTEFIQAGLPPSFATDLHGDVAEKQLSVVREMAQRVDTTTDLVATFYEVLSQQRLANRVTADRVSGKHLLHLSQKAVQYGVLMPKQRSALFSLGQQMLKRPLTGKQESYANSLLEKLQDKNVLTAACTKDPCALCEDFRRIVRSGNGTEC